VTLLGALVAIVCFAIAFEGLGILSVARRAIQSGVGATNVMRAALSDDEKEQAARAASVVLLQCFGSITVRSAAAVAASLLPLLMFDVAGIVDLSAVNDLLLSWRGLLLGSVAIGLVAGARLRR
jgi:hypothetical protein